MGEVGGRLSRLEEMIARPAAFDLDALVDALDVWTVTDFVVVAGFVPTLVAVAAVSVSLAVIAGAAAAFVMIAAGRSVVSPTS